MLFLGRVKHNTVIVTGICVLCMLCTLLLACGHVEKRYVSIKPPIQEEEKPVEKISRKITVNDFIDERDERDILGIDYTKGVDIVGMEPVAIGVAHAVGIILEHRGYDVMMISRKESPPDYIPDFDADYHLSGKIEVLNVKVKSKGLLTSIASMGRIHFSLYDRDGKVVWAGRMQADSTTSHAFVGTKAIEGSINECVKLLGEGLAGDDKFHKIIEKGDL